MAAVAVAADKTPLSESSDDWRETRDKSQLSGSWLSALVFRYSVFHFQLFPSPSVTPLPSISVSVCWLLSKTQAMFEAQTLEVGRARTPWVKNLAQVVLVERLSGDGRWLSPKTCLESFKSLAGVSTYS